ncbi:MAG: hypothetical protein LBV71_20005 [Prevotella sp.]|jgi:hypothetical protein|nr:hypothetical protein [Prevotella sp.]
MKKILYFITISILFTAFSCSDDDSAAYRDIGFGYCVVDQDGNDLFDQETAGAIDTSAIEIYNIIDGKPVLFRTNTGHKGYWFVKHEDSDGDGRYDNIPGLVMYIAILTYFDEEDKSTSIIKWNKQESDTVTILADRKINSTWPVHYWVNGSDNIDWINKDLRIARKVKQR